MKTDELTGAALDWAVAKAEGHSFVVGNGGWYSEERIHHKVWTLLPEIADNYECECYSPSTNWALGGAVIERERIQITPRGKTTNLWEAIIFDNIFMDNGSDCFQTGTTPLIAAMRCYVTSKLGDEVQIPEELIK